jgi:multidrug efflux pump subunit AcrB
MEAIALSAATLGAALDGVAGVTEVYGRSGAEAEAGEEGKAGYRREDLLFYCTLTAEAAAPANAERCRRAIERTLRDALWAEDGDGPGADDVAAGWTPNGIDTLLGLEKAQRYALKALTREDLDALAADVRARIAEAPGRLRWTAQPDGMRQLIKIYPRREALSFLGVSAAQIAQAGVFATEGVVVNTLEIDGKTVDLRVMGDAVADKQPLGKQPAAGKQAALVKEAAPALRLSTEDALARLPVAARENAPVLLGTVGRIVRGEAPEALARLDRSDVLYLDMLNADSSSPAYVNLIGTLEHVCKGFSRADESAFARYRQSLLLTIGLVLVLLYLTLGALFESFLLPLIFMLTIPFALAGAGPSLFLLNAGLDLGSCLGLVVLFGVVVNNGIVLYEAAALRVAEGKLNVREAVRAGLRDRFRAIITTTLTTAFVLVPVLFSRSGGTQKSMAAAMFGGTISSALLTVYVLPVILTVFLGRKGPLTTSAL